MQKLLTQNYKTSRTITLFEIFELLNEKFGLVYGEDYEYDWKRIGEIQDYQRDGYQTYRFKIVNSSVLRDEDKIAYQKEIALEEAQARGRSYYVEVNPNRVILHVHKDAKP